MNINSEQDNQSKLDNETPAGDELQNYFIESKGRMMELSLLFYRAANAI